MKYFQLKAIIYTCALFFASYINVTFTPALLWAQSGAARPGDAGLTFESLLEANREVILTARVTGIIKEIKVQEGEEVSEGDTLLILEDDEAWAQFKMARVRLEYAQKAFNGDSMLFTKEAISERRYLESKMQYAEAEAAMKLQDLQLRHTRFIAPFSGIVLTKEPTLGVGKLMRANTQVYSVLKFNPLKMVVYVSEQYSGKFKVGTKAEIRSMYNDNLRASAVVVAKSPVIDPSSGTNKISLTVNGNPGRLIPGMQVVVVLSP